MPDGSGVASRRDTGDNPSENVRAFESLERDRLRMLQNEEREMRELLVKLRSEHRDLDAEIVALESSGQGQQLHVRRLKKRKLQVKDQITAVEDKLTPDIIA